MADIAISAEGVGKRYRIGRRQDTYGRLTESLWGALRAPIDAARGTGRDKGEWVWALRDASFEVGHGEVVGVIGRNGAGKSTLLKVLSRITEPTTGNITLHGRVGSLLEVGTGFHPELTGRENVFLSGAVLGMRRAEIVRRFDEIVEFAGIGQFLDTPIKRYSSGMWFRLGFAVAAHMDTEILFIDEVLAVGDAAFQKKCLGRMSEIGQAGRTIMFVSHNMAAMLRLCERAVLLDRGRVVASGPTHAVVRAYLESGLGRSSERRWEDPASAPGNDVARLRLVRVVPTLGGRADEVDIREPIDIEIEYWTAGSADLQPLLNISAFNGEGVCLFSVSDESSADWRQASGAPGVIRSTCRIPGNFLAEGGVSINIIVATYNPTRWHAVERDAVVFQVVDRTEGDGVRGQFAGDWPGVVRPMLDWKVEWFPD